MHTVTSVSGVGGQPVDLEAEVGLMGMERSVKSGNVS